MGDIEHGTCDVCGTQADLSRKYYRYPVKCDCCNGKNDNHFEYVSYCQDCTPLPLRKITVHLEPIE